MFIYLSSRFSFIGQSNSPRSLSLILNFFAMLASLTFFNTLSLPHFLLSFPVWHYFFSLLLDFYSSHRLPLIVQLTPPSRSFCSFLTVLREGVLDIFHSVLRSSALPWPLCFPLSVMLVDKFLGYTAVSFIFSLCDSVVCKGSWLCRNSSLVPLSLTFDIKELAFVAVPLCFFFLH